MSSSSASVTKRPKISRFQAIGWLFGNPLETFDNLLPMVASVASVASPVSMDKSFCPTKQNVIQHWIFCYDKKRNSYHSPDKNAIISEVTDNLIAFWSNKTAIELR